MRTTKSPTSEKTPLLHGMETAGGPDTKKGLNAVNKHPQLEKFNWFGRNRVIDMTIAGFSLFATISSLGLLEMVVGVPLYAGPMLASGIIFFVGAEPPSPKAFLWGTLCTVTLGVLLFTLFTTTSSFLDAKNVHEKVFTVIAQGASAGALLIWYKCTGAIFPPVVTLSGIIVTSILVENSAQIQVAGPHKSLLLLWGSGVAWKRLISFLFFPWLAGHAILYGVAHLISRCRTFVRAKLTQSRLHQAVQSREDVKASKERLKEMFKAFDTTGDDELDAFELKIALRLETGADLPVEDCKAMIEATDRNGNGTIDFEEFCHILQGEF